MSAGVACGPHVDTWTGRRGLVGGLRVHTRHASLPPVSCASRSIHFATFVEVCEGEGDELTAVPVVKLPAKKQRQKHTRARA